MSTEKKRRKPEKTTETGFTQRISKEYYNLTAAEKKAADYVVAHRAEAQNLSITELAAASDVAEATISRFVRRLKYKGYNEFRLDIARSVTASSSGLSPLSGEVTDGDSFSEIIRKIYTADVDAITQTLELIDERKIKRRTAEGAMPLRAVVRRRRFLRTVVARRTGFDVRCHDCRAVHGLAFAHSDGRVSAVHAAIGPDCGRCHSIRLGEDPHDGSPMGHHDLRRNVYSYSGFVHRPPST